MKGRKHTVHQSSELSSVHPAVLREGAHGFFASSNSGDGFYSLYNEVFGEENFERVYILKGGPGTGKSTLIDKIAAHASSLGYETDVFVCSSDNKSLDGLIIHNLKVAILDGTAPHTFDPKYPGAVGEIVNLGSMWNSRRLAEGRGEIIHAITEKSANYARAYRLLSCAATARRDILAVAHSALISDKMSASCARLLSRNVSSSGVCGVTHRLVSGYTCGGNISLCTLNDLCETKITVSESGGIGYYYLDTLEKLALSREIAHMVLPDPLLPDMTEAIYFPSDKVLYKIASGDEYEEGNIRVNTARFSDADIMRQNRVKLRFSARICETLTDEALASIAAAGEIHSGIEKLYKSAMDFDGVTEIVGRLDDKIFGV